MTDLAIRVQSLGKRYQIGERVSYRRLTETLTNALAAAFQKKADQTPRGTFWALKDVSFEVRQGEVLGIIGRNGAGKSTLLKILSRVTEMTEGSVDLYGRIGSLLEVGTGFHPELTGRENIYLNGAILGMKRPEIRRKFDEIVAFAEVKKFLDTPVKHYSSGMYMRLAFAVAAHLEPEILVVDEVLAVGDAAFQKKCLGKMGEVAREGRTVLFVSHNMSAIERLCSRTILLSKGAIAMDGVTMAVVAQYMSRADLDDEEGRHKLRDDDNALIRFLAIEARRGVEQMPATKFFTGDSVSFEIEVERMKNTPDLMMGLHLYDKNHVRLFAFNDQERGFRPGYTKGLAKFRLTIPFLPLLPGTYTINLVGYLKGTGIVNEQSSVLTIEVGAADLYESGYPFVAGHGIILIDHTWSVVGTSHA
jgi:lipopolysaccharide transport system ATP-binding protein